MSCPNSRYIKNKQNTIEIIHKEYECADKCCYEDWFEISINDKFITYIDEYGYEHNQKFLDFYHDLDIILEFVTKEKFILK